MNHIFTYQKPHGFSQCTTFLLVGVGARGPAPHQTVPVATPLRPSRPSSAKVSQKRAAARTARSLDPIGGWKWRSGWVWKLMGFIREKPIYKYGFFG